LQWLGANGYKIPALAAVRCIGMTQYLVFRA
jgi:hypothetical protein